MRHQKRLGIVGIGACAAAALAMMTAAAAWACVPTATLNLTTTQASPGDTVGLSGNSYNKNPVLVHFNAIDGPVVATLTPVSGRIEGPMTVPAGTPGGTYVLVATEEAAVGSQTWGIPVRALLNVTDDHGGVPVPVAPAPLARTAGLVHGASIDGGTLALAGLGGAGVAILLAGLATLAVGSRRRSAVASPASSER